jgi:hypothetical protein
MRAFPSPIACQPAPSPKRGHEWFAFLALTGICAVGR